MRYRSQRSINLGLVRSPLRVPAVYFYLIRKGCCCCSVAKSCLSLCDPMDCSMPGLPVPHRLPELALVSVHEVGDAIHHFILCHPLFLLPSISSSIRVFSSESAVCNRWPKYWSLNFSISPSDEYSGLISFRIDGLDLLAVQGTLKSHLQHHSLKAPVLQCSAFFMVQLLHLYTTTGKVIALIIWIFVSSVILAFYYDV